MSELAHQYQQEYDLLKEEFKEYESRFPLTDAQYPRGDWVQGSTADLKNMLDINKEQIRVVNCILDERNRQAEENRAGHDDGHQGAIELWGGRLGVLKGTRHLISQTRNLKLGLAARNPGAAMEDTEAEDSDVSLTSIPWLQPEYNNYTRDNPATSQWVAAEHSGYNNYTIDNTATWQQDAAEDEEEDAAADADEEDAEDEEEHDDAEDNSE